MSSKDDLRTPSFVRRHPANPILTPEQVPFECKLAYNPGVAKKDGRYWMVFRSDHGWDPDKKKAPIFRLGLAESLDGVSWSIHPEPILEGDGDEVQGVLDPRLAVWDDGFLMTYAKQTKHGLNGMIVTSKDLKEFDLLHQTVPDNRNIVIFPKQVDGRWIRLERPFPYMSRDNQPKFDVWLSESPDLVHWGHSQLFFTLEDVPWCDQRVGAGSPPVPTDEGWLVLFHAVDTDPSRGKNGWEDKWISRYCAGALLLDLDDPRKKIAWTRRPLLVPETDNEIAGGFRGNVVFPTALIPEEDGTAKMYYGASDTTVGLAEVSMRDLVDFTLRWGEE